MQTAIPPKTWPDIIRDLCSIVEWAERFPDDGTKEASEWAQAEITRIGDAIEALPAEHKLQLPEASEYVAAMVAVDLAD